MKVLADVVRLQSGAFKKSDLERHSCVIVAVFVGDGYVDSCPAYQNLALFIVLSAILKSLCPLCGLYPKCM